MTRPAAGDRRNLNDNPADDLLGFQSLEFQAVPRFRRAAEPSGAAYGVTYWGPAGFPDFSFPGRANHDASDVRAAERLVGTRAALDGLMPGTEFVSPIDGNAGNGANVCLPPIAQPPAQGKRGKAGRRTGAEAAAPVSATVRSTASPMFRSWER